MINVGVLGATGAVGQRFVQLLAEHPWFNLSVLTASERSAGKKYGNAVNWRLDTPFPESVADMEISPTTVDAVKDCDLVFSALPAGIAGSLEAAIADAGIGVCSNARSHRMDPDVPLIIPEVNPDHLGLIDVQHDNGRDGFIVTNPNCSTITIILAMAPLRRFGFSSIQVATMQAISGAGFEGVPGMAIMDNVIPFIGDEEEKIESESLKILGHLDGDRVTDARLNISASCHRVPVIDGHTVAVWTDVSAPIDDVKKAFASFNSPFDNLPLQPAKAVELLEEPDRPQPRLDRNRGGGMTVSVGRVREGLRFVALGHNTIRGAAGASVLNAELIHSRKYL
ncbi:MAG: aspartate-semialdehyde dehydrogenase [Methanoculleaceae archaeon]